MKEPEEKNETTFKPASPWGKYDKIPRRCLECGSRDLINDGRYWCASCHPDRKGDN